LLEARKVICDRNIKVIEPWSKTHCYSVQKIKNIV
jgi:hypothetical protein